VCARDYDVTKPMGDPFLYILFQRAMSKHKQLTQESMAGQVKQRNCCVLIQAASAQHDAFQGCDRHLLGLRVAASCLGLEVPLFKNKLVLKSSEYRLSTSNVPTKGLGELQWCGVCG
jgi:hypothetical protein